jgi:hypothetical protein
MSTEPEDHLVYHPHGINGARLYTCTREQALAEFDRHRANAEAIAEHNGEWSPDAEKLAVYLLTPVRTVTLTAYAGAEGPKYNMVVTEEPTP